MACRMQYVFSIREAKGSKVMPKYEYACERCGARFETMQSIKADPLTTCEVCHDNTLYRVIHAAGIKFKGRGFYTTDKDYDALDKDLYDNRHLL